MIKCASKYLPVKIILFFGHLCLATIVFLIRQWHGAKFAKKSVAKDSFTLPGQ
jgi:hypothetical protein